MSGAASWFKFYPSDWLGGTAELTVTELAVYITLIAQMYDHGEPIEIDVSRLAKRLGITRRLTAESIQSLVALEKLSVTESGRFWNARTDKEIEIRQAKTNKAKASSQFRWSKKDSENKSPPEETHSRNDATRYQIPDSREESPLTPLAGGTVPPAEPAEKAPDSKPEKEPEKEPEKKPEKPKAEPKGSRIPDDFEPDLAWAELEGLHPSQTKREAAKFRDFWLAKTGADARKVDWPATWRTWVRRALERMPRSTGPPARPLSEYRQRQNALWAELDAERGVNPDEQEPSDSRFKHSIDH